MKDKSQLRSDQVQEEAALGIEVWYREAKQHDRGLVAARGAVQQGGCGG